MPELAPWEQRLHALLPLYGHRNWIVVADSAYPVQSQPGVETIVTGADHLEIVRKVRDAIAASRHVRAHIRVDKEFAFVAEADSPGIGAYRSQLNEILAGAHLTPIPHIDLIGQIDQASTLFSMLVLKTDLTIPYSSVFFELDCGYWNAEAEQRTRQAMLAADDK